MKVSKLKETLEDVWGELTYGVRWLCLRPSPGKRLVTVLALAIIFGGLNIWFIVSSIYRMGKNEAEKQFLELQHIKQPELKNDSIQSIKNENEK